MKLILFFITIVFAGACYGYAQLAFNPDISRVPVWALRADKGTVQAKKRRTILILLTINTLTAISSLIWGVMHWSILGSIVSFFIFGWAGMSFEIWTEHRNKQTLLIIPMYSTFILGLLLWML